MRVFSHQGDDNAKCNTCGKVLVSRDGNISGLWRHLNFNHKEMYNEFEKKKKELKDIKPANERQRKRMAVLDWVKEKDCPDRAQLNPELCGWTQLKGENGTEAPIKSCKVDPESKKRSKPAAGDKAADDVCDMIKFQKTIKGVGPKGSYSIIEQDGFIHFVQYKTDAEKTKEGEEEEP